MKFFRSEEELISKKCILSNTSIIYKHISITYLYYCFAVLLLITVIQVYHCISKVKRIYIYFQLGTNRLLAVKKCHRLKGIKAGI